MTYWDQASLRVGYGEVRQMVKWNTIYMYLLVVLNINTIIYFAVLYFLVTILELLNAFIVQNLNN